MRSVLRRCAVLVVVVLAPLVLVTGCGKDTSSSAASSAAPASVSSRHRGRGNVRRVTPLRSRRRSSWRIRDCVRGLSPLPVQALQAGTFQKGADGRVTAFVKGGVAALFIKREIRLASEDVMANPNVVQGDRRAAGQDR